MKEDLFFFGFIPCVKVILIISIMILLLNCSEKEPDSTLPAAFVEVYKFDGSRQCGTAGLTVALMASELINEGIDIICSYKSQLNGNVGSSCESMTGRMNVYKIHIANLSDAEDVGFKSANEVNHSPFEECL